MHEIKHYASRARLYDACLQATPGINILNCLLRGGYNFTDELTSILILSPFLTQNSLPEPYVAAGVTKPICVVVLPNSEAETHVLKAQILARREMNAVGCDAALASLLGKANTHIFRFIGIFALLREAEKCMDLVTRIPSDASDEDSSGDTSDQGMFIRSFL